MITNQQSRTRIDEIAPGIYRISTPLPPVAVPGGFSFNQYLVAAEQPLLFHTGPRGMFALTCEAIKSVIPVESLQYVGFSHFESDECGAINEFLKAAPHAKPLCGQINALINADSFDRPPRPLAEGESLALGKHVVQWFDTPHLPHAWECGYLFEKQSRTLLCGDLFTQGGDDNPAITESDILGPSDAFRRQMDYYAHAKNTKGLLDKLAATNPTTLACMHGSAWHGDGARLLHALCDSLG
jgi:flavorubredoxin